MCAAVVVDRDAIARIHPKLAGVAVVAVAARHDDVQLARLALLEQRGDQLGRVLKVRVHDADPRTARLAHALEHRGAQPADSPLGRLRHEHELVVAVLRQRVDKLARAVVAVVDEDDLHRDRGQRGLEPLHQRGYVVALVLGRYDDRTGAERLASSTASAGGSGAVSERAACTTPDSSASSRAASSQGVISRSSKGASFARK